MNSETSWPAQDSSSSGVTALSPHSESVLELGKKLVNELGLNDSNDTLARWMAHYVAELIRDAENVQGDERLKKMQVCSDAILSLWRHRHELPSGKRPFEEMEPMLRALESLDPKNETPRYFGAARRPVQVDGEGAEARKWLEAMDDLDQTARILIRHCLARAAESALDKSKAWVALAENAGFGDRFELPVIVRFVAEEGELGQTRALSDAAREVVQERIERLESFMRTASVLAQDLQEELKQLEIPS